MNNKIEPAISLHYLKAVSIYRRNSMQNVHIKWKTAL